MTLAAKARSDKFDTSGLYSTRAENGLAGDASVARCIKVLREERLVGSSVAKACAGPRICWWSSWSHDLTRPGLCDFRTPGTTNSTSKAVDAIPMVLDVCAAVGERVVQGPVYERGFLFHSVEDSARTNIVHVETL